MDSSNFNFDIPNNIPKHEAEMKLMMTMCNCLSEISPDEDKAIWQIPVEVMRLSNLSRDVMNYVEHTDDMDKRRERAKKVISILKQTSGVLEKAFEEIKESESHA